MESAVVVGLQWGDEGKGKIVDYLSPNYDIIARFQGGNNAGHTIMFNGQTYKLSLVPSGIFCSKIAYIGPGVVLDPSVLLSEMEYLKEMGFDTKKYLKIAENTHVILELHKKLDARNEECVTNTKKIGTTKRGIGFAYQDKVARSGIRICDIPSTELLMHAVENLYNHNKSFIDFTQEDIATTVSSLKSFYGKVKDLLVHPVEFMNANIDKSVLFEGAQGILLDVTFGTYPYVTSSNTVSGQCYAGSGFGKIQNKKVFGIVKAYSTRVGEGPFPTEDFDTLGQNLQTQGKEVGTITQRKRRCGPLDLVALKYACDVSGATDLIITKIDVLDDLSEIPLCIEYENFGKVFPLSTQSQSQIKPKYITMKGWNQKTGDIQDYTNLPSNAKEYIEYIENYTGVKVTLISNGPDRNSIILKK
jgi:adenylosuccinate synthase